jgi:hypothetical protein
MAEIVLTDAHVEIGSLDVSDHVRSLTISYKAEAPEKTAMGDTAKTRLGGLLDWSLDVELNQDYADASIDSVLFDLVGTSVALIMRPTSDPVGAANPEFTGDGIFTDYDPIAGKVGDVAITKLKFVGNGVLERAVA